MLSLCSCVSVCVGCVVNVEFGDLGLFGWDGGKSGG